MINNMVVIIVVVKVGVGIVYLLEGRISKEIDEGLLEVILEEWVVFSEFFYMYYSSWCYVYLVLCKFIDIICL